MLMSVVGCGEQAKTPKPTELKTFSNYGFSFDYPTHFAMLEMGLMDSEPNDDSGMIQVMEENEKDVRLFQASYIRTATWDLESSLEGGFEGLEGAEGVASIEAGEIVEATKEEYPMLYQYYNFTDTEDVRFYGIMSVFYCEKNQKLFALITMNSTISAKKDIIEDFQTYLDSFVCF